MAESPVGLGRENILATYDIVLVVEGQFAVGSTGTIASTRATLRPYVDDGAGNGIVPVLMAHPTLAGLCRRSKITAADEMILESKSTTASTLVVYAITFECAFTVQL